jgi:hypothetical protein
MTGGSAMRFFHPKTQHVITVHKPHDGEMTRSMIERLRTDLVQRGVL